MGLLDKLLKKGLKADLVSKGRSPIYHHDEKKDKEWRSPQAYGEYGEEITRHLGALFPGREESVFHEILSDLVRIDVNIMRPRGNKPYYMIYITGMSDLPMTLSEEIAHREDLKYGELLMSLPKEWSPGETEQPDPDISDSQYRPIRLIKYLARFPHEYSTWLGWDYTIPNGPDYKPLCQDTQMGGVILVQVGGGMGFMKVEDREEINFYMVVSAYEEEIEYKLKYGMETLDKRFCDGNLPMVLDTHRPNHCEDLKVS